MHTSVLLYGPPGAGKTALAVSSFWDYQKRDLVPGRVGRVLFIGREDNTSLHIPDEMVRRFRFNDQTPTSFMDEFESYVRALRAAARAEKGPTDIVVDGWTELGYLYTWAYETAHSAGDNWAGWRDWKRRFLGLVMLLNPVELNANVFGTARVGQVKKSQRTRSGKEIEGDPDWLAEFKYIPLMEGFARDMLAYYFQHVVYMEAEQRTVFLDGRRHVRTYYLSHWMPHPDYLVKNIAGHIWETLQFPSTLENVMWRDVEQYLLRVYAADKPS